MFSIKELFLMFKGLFPFLETRNNRKIAEIPMKKEEHEENKEVRLIKVEISKLDNAKRLLREYERLEKKANKLNVDFEDLKNELQLFDIEKELEIEEDEFVEKLPESRAKKKLIEIIKNRRNKRNKPKK